MLQRGVNISSLDTSYITSMSWYYLVMPNPNPHPCPNPDPDPNPYPNPYPNPKP